jgi:ABC-type nickel/cobalt efflux system permease component RcnA
MSHADAAAEWLTVAAQALVRAEACYVAHRTELSRRYAAMVHEHAMDLEEQRYLLKVEQVTGRSLGKPSRQPAGRP